MYLYNRNETRTGEELYALIDGLGLSKPYMGCRVKHKDNYHPADVLKLYFDGDLTADEKTNKLDPAIEV